MKPVSRRKEIHRESVGGAEDRRRLRIHGFCPLRPEGRKEAVAFTKRTQKNKETEAFPGVPGVITYRPGFSSSDGGGLPCLRPAGWGE